jgi:hypothetical protein
MKKRHAWLLACSVCAPLPAISQEVTIGGAVREIVSEGSSLTFTGPTRCEKWTISGRVEIRSFDESRQERLSSSHSNQCGQMNLPNTIKVACDEIEFVEGAELATWSNLLLYGGRINGPLRIVGMRNRAGDSGAPIDRSPSELHGDDGDDGRDGQNGRNAGTSLRGGKYSARRGENGGHGQHGGHGKAGAHGSAGGLGENNVCITVHTENFDGENPIFVTAAGGAGGDGSDGQTGGNGGRGGAGGHGGNGWKRRCNRRAVRARRARRQRGNGGDGGNGGNGGDGGAGGDGGRIEVVIQEDESGRGTRPARGLKLTSDGGHGGLPGVRGNGGAGGPPGPRGHGGRGGDGSLIYDPANPGSAGRNGQPGRPGEEGVDGSPGARGLDGEIVENVIGYGRVNTPSPVEWDLMTQ